MFCLAPAVLVGAAAPVVFVGPAAAVVAVGPAAAAVGTAAVVGAVGTVVLGGAASPPQAASRLLNTITATTVKAILCLTAESLIIEPVLLELEYVQHPFRR